MDLTVLIPALNEADNIVELLPFLENTIQALGLSYELLVVDGGSTDGTQERASSVSPRVRVIQQQGHGYGRALLQGFSEAQGEHVLTLDADLSHDPTFLASFWEARYGHDLIIGSRYIQGGKAQMPRIRRMLSRLLNSFFRHGLSMPWKDLSSGFRLYRAQSIKSMNVQSRDFDILQEILIKCFTQGGKIKEIPIFYRPRKTGQSHVRLLHFGIAYLRTFYRMWKLRNSIESADYDDRAYDSIIPLQRYWQRSRHKYLGQFAKGHSMILDIGCGSGRVLNAGLPIIGLDILLNKLRYSRKFGRPLVNASIWALPFRDAAFDCVICSEVIEHIPAGTKPFLEMRRVLKPNGTLVLGTPDYAHRTWRIIEAIYGAVAPGGYADEHITHYTLESLTDLLLGLGFTLKEEKYILNSELILQCKYDFPAKIISQEHPSDSDHELEVDKVRDEDGEISQEVGYDSVGTKRH